MTAAVYGWCHKDRGREQDRECVTCGRPTYITKGSDLLRCDGCGEIHSACWCPDARVAV